MAELPRSTSSFEHGAIELPLVRIDDYNIQLRDRDGFIGDRANRQAFFDRLAEAAKLARLPDDHPLHRSDAAINKKAIEALLADGDAVSAAVVHTAIEAFAQDLADVITRFLRTRQWAETERIVVGGGLSAGRIGPLIIARTALILRSAQLDLDLVPIRSHPDEAGLSGSGHLMPSWVLDGHDAMLAIDIGGTNIRAGIVRLELDKAGNLARAYVSKRLLWRHADDSPDRKQAVARIVRLLKKLIGIAEGEGLKLAPLIGIACPGIIETDGAIAAGGQNLPGGNWESSRFNLPRSLMEKIPAVGNHATTIIMHNDAVVQGLSELPAMRDVTRWGVLTIGTGLGNARYSNKPESGPAPK